MKDVLKKVWPELANVPDEDFVAPDQPDLDVGRSSLMDIEDPDLRKSLEVMQTCFVSPGHRATLTMFLTELLELEDREDILRKLQLFHEKYAEKYIEKFNAYFTFYTRDHEKRVVRESAQKYYIVERVRKDSSTFRAVQMETSNAANAVVEKAIDPRSTDTHWPVPSQMRPPSHRSPSSSSIPAARQTHQGVNSERSAFKAANIDAIFAEGRQAAGLDDEKNSGK